MRNPILAAVAAIGVCICAAQAQTSTPATPGKEVFKYITPAELEAAMQKHNTNSGTSNIYIIRYPDFSGQVVDRIKTGRVEAHDKWTDFIMVVEGNAILTIDGTINDKTVKGDAANGEWDGESITGGKDYEMVPGAIFILPPGTPHWMRVPDGGHVRMVTFKRPAP